MKQHSTFVKDLRRGDKLALSENSPGSGYDETGQPPLLCEDCEGDGKARCEMRGCKERAIGFSDDGEALCEDCLAEWCENVGASDVYAGDPD